jgi:hypothetical protein
MGGSRPVQVDSLYRQVRSVLDQARSTAYCAVNFAMVGAYWQVGRLIVEHEQGGRRRAHYGEALLENLSARLTADFARGSQSRICVTCASSTSLSRFTTQCVMNRKREGNGKPQVPNPGFSTQRATIRRASGPNFPGPTTGSCSESKMPPRANGT